MGNYKFTRSDEKIDYFLNIEDIKILAKNEEELETEKIYNT